MIYRAAIIGCGWIGSEFNADANAPGVYSHAAAYAACPDTALVAVCDANPDRVARCGQRWHVAAQYHDADRLLAEQRPDLVSICTPDDTHYDLVRAAITAPGVRAVLAEKPLALTVDQAIDLAGLAQKNDILLAVNYSRRYADSHIRIQELLRAGGIGQVQTVNGFYTKGVLHNGTHWFDLARLLVGEVGRVWGVDVRKDGRPDPTLDVFLELQCGATAYLHGCNEKAFSVFEMDLLGTRGRIRITESGESIETYTVVDDTQYAGYRTLTLTNRTAAGLHNVLLHAVEDLVASVTRGRPPLCTAWDGVEALRIAAAARESARSGEIVTLTHDCASIGGVL